MRTFHPVDHLASLRLLVIPRKHIWNLIYAFDAGEVRSESVRVLRGELSVGMRKMKRVIASSSIAKYVIYQKRGKGPCRTQGPNTLVGFSVKHFLSNRS